MKYVLVVVIAFWHLAAIAQDADSTYVGPQPPMSLSALSLHYYSVDWTPAQWDTLRGRELELFYLVDEIGEPFLQTVRGIDEPAILDSLRIATGRLLYFKPARSEGKITDGVFGFYFTFPDRAQAYDAARYIGPWTGIVGAYIPSEQLTKDYVFDRFNFVIDYNALFADYVGAPNRYAKPGGGFDLVFAGRWSPRWGAGVAIGLDAAGLSSALPEDPLNRSDGRLFNGFIAATADRVFNVSPSREWMLRGELGAGFFGIANDDDENPDGSLEYVGLHTGLLLHYSNPFGDFATGTGGATLDQKGRVQRAGFGYNLFAGVRYRYLGDRSGTGVYYVLGAGFRIVNVSFRKRN